MFVYLFFNSEMAPTNVVISFRFLFQSKEDVIHAHMLSMSSVQGHLELSLAVRSLSLHLQIAKANIF
jgi:hypothetical protein